MKARPHRAAFLATALLATVFTLAGCSEAPAPAEKPATESADAPPETSPSEPALRVATLSHPVDYLVERLAGERIERRLALPAGEEPPFWRPPAETIAELQQVDLVVMSGAGYEAWTEQATLPLSRLVDAADGLDLIRTQGRTHSHGAGGEHSHSSLDPHVWMDPRLYLEQARRIDAALRESGLAETEIETLESELDALAAELDAALEPFQDAALVANHPSYAYLARGFGLEIDVLDLDAHHSPETASEKAVRRFAAWAEGREDIVIVWTEKPSEATRSAIADAASGTVRHVVIDPLEQPAGERYDYLAQARANVERLRQLASGP